MYIDNLHTLVPADFLKASRLSGLYFNYLRSGLDFVLKQSSLKDLENKKVLVPAFICPIIPEVFKRNGFDIKYADADLATFNMDLSDLKGSSVVLVCHTFGAKCDIPEGVTVIEDCAHFLSKKREGDFILYSLSKQLPNVRGGYIDTYEDLSAAYEHLPRDRYGLADIIVKLGWPCRNVLNYLRTKKRLNECEPASSEKWDVKKASWLVFGHDPDRNSEIYDQLCEHFDNLNLGKDFIKQELPAGSVPYNFSLRLRDNDPMRRDDILLRLRRKGVFGDRLWYNADTRGLPNATLLARTVINLPLHPQVLVKFSHAAHAI
ncbi:hypothetical protein COW94_02680 [Candidatus Peregrinibacteria bacterium CG22_combo_CG10-13_8_21_14_all_44_10]|nr:MAG: hypothetical protein AUK45_03160 [Candidatus Peregrinibacteria bacterium CG2_30_44_17]PIP66266.1 MAG: hypothetical protein COW94_02680 [Candidatus Peregrinibacteria bacterium CG22_combo_CG10-13_8_21_14_all_44_10]PIS03502.1 MAG: hypothetical protein COT83_05725 [Candidatus Peregrinibacteria bacterium CG10_big_fil_rev_8_21_14_0_10_44_7]PJB89069.1 MAG: hypothetical protein CO082_02300 [Candidatus Peregrinibacteria bacterium CG_4_9_14_0_8_um_filter_44_15]